jgi:hypothetical protein
VPTDKLENAREAFVDNCDGFKAIALNRKERGLIDTFERHANLRGKCVQPSELCHVVSL